MHIKIVLSILCLAAAISCVSPDERDSDLELVRLDNREPVNIIYILSDDHSYKNMSHMGHEFLKTPNMDAMAENGVRMVNAMVTTSLCSPSRASILTGQYAFTHGVINNSSPDPD